MSPFSSRLGEETDDCDSTVTPSPFPCFKHNLPPPPLRAKFQEPRWIINQIRIFHTNYFSSPSPFPLLSLPLRASGGEGGGGCICMLSGRTKPPILWAFRSAARTIDSSPSSLPPSSSTLRVIETGVMYVESFDLENTAVLYDLSRAWPCRIHSGA